MKKVNKIRILFLLLVFLMSMNDIRVNAKGISYTPMKSKISYRTIDNKPVNQSKKVKKKAKELYRSISTKKKTKIRYKASRKNETFYYDVYRYMNIKYYPYAWLPMHDSETDGIYVTDTFLKKDLKATLRQNKKMKEQVDNIIKESGVTKQTTQYDAVIKLNNWVIDNCEYVILEKDSLGFYTSMIQNGYKGVCHDYAILMQLLCQRVGIKCAYIKDDPGNHAFNVAKIDGIYYYFDTTWNDPGDYPDDCRNQWLMQDKETFTRDNVHQSMEYFWGIPLSDSSIP